MRILAVLGVLMAAAFLLAGTRPSLATQGPWCAYDREGGVDCSQPSHEMCLFTVLPQAGWCYPNDRYRPTFQRPAPIKKRAAR
jgi:hypothetical protein